MHGFVLSALETAISAQLTSFPGMITQSSGTDTSLKKLLEIKNKLEFLLYIYKKVQYIIVINIQIYGFFFGVPQGERNYDAIL